MGDINNGFWRLGNPRRPAYDADGTSIFQFRIARACFTRGSSKGSSHDTHMVYFNWQQ